MLNFLRFFNPLYCRRIERANCILREELQESISELFERDRQYDESLKRVLETFIGKECEVGGIKFRARV